MQKQITELEAKLAFMENTIESLNDVIVEQADNFDLLKKEILFLKEKLNNIEMGGGGTPDDGPPPHY